MFIVLLLMIGNWVVGIYLYSAYYYADENRVDFISCKLDILILLSGVVGMLVIVIGVMLFYLVKWLYTLPWVK